MQAARLRMLEEHSGSGLADAVRVLMALGHEPTIAPGDRIARPDDDGTTDSLVVEAVSAIGYHTLREARRAAEATSRYTGDAAVVLRGTVYNVAQLSRRAEPAELLWRTTPTNLPVVLVLAQHGTSIEVGRAHGASDARRRHLALV